VSELNKCVRVVVFLVLEETAARGRWVFWFFSSRNRFFALISRRLWESGTWSWLFAFGTLNHNGTRC